MGTIELPDSVIAAMNDHLDGHPHFDEPEELIEEWVNQHLGSPARYE